MINLTKKQEILEVSDIYNISLSKKSGQCILIDTNIADFIIENAKFDKENDIVLEIGPGFGILTEKIIERCKKLYVVEKDSRLVKYLRHKFKEYSNIEIIEGDTLKVDFPKHNKLVSNLPYHISGPFIQKMITDKNRPETGILMLQDEFIKKMLSVPKPKNYGRSSIIASLFLDIKRIRKVPPTVFYPKPRVNSGIIKFNMKDLNLSKINNIDRLGQFFGFLSGIFPYKNKTLRNSLKLLEKNISKNKENYSKDLLVIFQKNQISFQDYLESNFEYLSKKRLWQCEPQEILEIFNSIFKN